MIRRELKKSTGVVVTPEDIVGAIRHMLNEAAGAEMETMKISLPGQNSAKIKSKASVT